MHSVESRPASPKARRFAVVGGGVIGLSTAVLAQQRGHSATLYTDSLPLQTTSAKAAASFKPNEVAQNELTQTMLVRSFEYFARLADEPGRRCGVSWHTHWEASSAPLVDSPYLAVMKDLEVLERPDVPGGYAYGRRYTTFFIDTPIYLPWLYAEFQRSGGVLVHLPRRYEAVEELARLPHDVIFNCTGLGSRALCNDHRVYAVKGQIALVGPRPDMDWSISADGFYVYPRTNDTVLGGTAERYVDTETNDWAALALLIRGNRRILPDLTEASILRAAAGLRPYREESVRVEAEALRDRCIVHNYGHGGAGVTLSWGSADRALELALGA